MIRPPDPLVLSPKDPDFARQVWRLPRRDGIYLLEFEAGSGQDPVEPYLGTSRYLYKRIARLFGQESSGASGQEPSPGARARLHASVQVIRCWPTASRLESWLLLCAIARERFPRHYRQRLKLRAPAFVSLLNGDPFPRLAAGNRIPRSSIPIGPFRTRDLADAFLQEACGLFQLRRCEDTLEPDADHPGCIYGEMSLCLRPCQLAVSAAEYASEARRAAEFLSSSGDSLLRPLSAARDQASETMDFEQAARLHKQVEKIKAVCALRGELVRPLDQLHGIAVTHGGTGQAVRLWPMVAGYWQAPINLDFAPVVDPRVEQRVEQQVMQFDDASQTLSPPSSRTSSPPASMDALLRQSLDAHLAHPQADGSRIDDLALLARWFYSSWRDGAWLSFSELSKLNYRKLVREISTLLKDGKA